MQTNNELFRRQTKSADGAFLYELQHGYELSPKLSEQILIKAKEMLSRSHHQAKMYQGGILDKLDIENIQSALQDGRNILAIPDFRFVYINGSKFNSKEISLEEEFKA